MATVALRASCRRHERLFCHLRGDRLLSDHASIQAAPRGSPLRQLPLVTLYLTERCNSRCVTCDYWRYGREDLSLATIQRMLPSLQRLGTRVVLMSGGEPLLNPQWVEIADLLRSCDIEAWLLTSGLSLAKHASRVSRLFQSVTVSLDGTSPDTYAAIRGLDAFDKVCAGIRSVATTGTPVGLRVTLQRANYRELPSFVRLAHELGVRQISFLAVDVANPHAFGRTDTAAPDVALQQSDLNVLDGLLRSLEEQHAADFRSGFIAESPAKLRRILQYFAALQGQAGFPPVRCNAPEFSAVIDSRLRVRPCFFIPGPPGTRVDEDLSLALNGEAMISLRADIRERRRPECVTCICSMYRERWQ